MMLFSTYRRIFRPRRKRSPWRRTLSTVYWTTGFFGFLSTLYKITKYKGETSLKNKDLR